MGLWPAGAVSTCPAAKMTGDPGGLGRYGMVTPLGGDWSGEGREGGEGGTGRRRASRRGKSEEEKK